MTFRNKKQIEDVEGRIALKLDVQVFADTKAYIGQLCEAKDLDILRRQVMPVVDIFSNKIDKFQETIQQSEQIIQR